MKNLEELNKTCDDIAKVIEENPVRSAIFALIIGYILGSFCTKLKRIFKF